MNKTHYIYGSGMLGCLYDFCGASETLDEAVEALAANFDLGRTRKARLKRDRILTMKPIDGAEYCEIKACHCSVPWGHDENSGPEDWPEYRMDENRGNK
jgi:hypothetical protein